MAASLHPIPPRKKFSRALVDRMQEAGVFQEERLELIDGELIDKMGQNPPHSFLLRKLRVFLDTVFGEQRVLVQQPVEAASGERERTLPEPDLAVLREDSPDYRTRHPRGDELVLVVEVADTTVHFDLTVKAGIYARAGVPEYWVADLNRNQIIVHRLPREGEYRELRHLSGDDVVAPGSSATAAELFD